MKRNEIIYIQTSNFWVMALKCAPAHFQVVIFAGEGELDSNEVVEALDELFSQADQLVKVPPSKGSCSNFLSKEILPNLTGGEKKRQFFCFVVFFLPLL